ncbi:MAG: hypothetical protein EOL97_08645 [Spirochaetia bacterium]|nr:hypothetical protein [Spirochaetia bacterium]
MVKLQYVEGWETPIVTYEELRIIDDETEEIIASHKYNYDYGEVLESGENLVSANDEALSKVISHKDIEGLHDFLTIIDKENIELPVALNNKLFANVIVLLDNLNTEIQEIKNARLLLNKYTVCNMDFNNAVDKVLENLKDKQETLNKLLL